MAKKKGPPYTDDPGCKFIVIDDPWPGNAAGRDRKDAYWNLLGAWVWYMLDKKEIPDTIYSVNTRAEVIVRLPEQVDIEPILGAHAWITFLHHGAEADRHRVSCIFEYNYRIKGDPAYHNWAEHMPIGGEPPANRRFPVKFPYPPPGWASPAHKNSRDISLSLPPTRERVPVVDVPVVDPSGAANNVHPPTPVARTEVTVEPEATQEEQPAQAHVAKPDPYEEEDVALQFVKQEPVDSDVRAGRRTEGEVKQEPTDVPVKREEIPEPQHSAEYLAEFERYRLHTSISQGTGEETTAQSESINDGVERIGDPLLHAHRSHSIPRVKPEPEDASPLSGMLPQPVTPRPPRLPESSGHPEVRVKPEPQEGLLPPPHTGSTSNPQLSAVRGQYDGRTRDPRTHDPRLQQRNPPKRVREEEHEGNVKRIKAERSP